MDGETAVAWAQGRAFVPLAVQGCGSGCKYCYISAPAGQQHVLSPSAARDAVKQLTGDPRFAHGHTGTILTLGPDTEPFKTPSSTELVCSLLSELLPLGNPIQLSTKEVMPSAVRELLRGSPNPAQVVVFTSFTSFARAQELEPGAAAPTQRLANFSASEGFTSCALFKPFLPQTAREADVLIEHLVNARPDAVCIGIAYTKRSEGLDHPVEHGWRSTGLTTSMHAFRDLVLVRVGVPTFFSSTCVNAYFLNRPAPGVLATTPFLCIGCGRCPPL